VYCIHVVQLHAQSPDISSVHDPFTIPFDRILHFFSLGPPVANLCAKFVVSSFDHFRDMESVFDDDDNDESSVTTSPPSQQ